MWLLKGEPYYLISTNMKQQYYILYCYIFPPRCLTCTTRQSEMANTSPRHMPPGTCQCLATFTPIKIEKIWYFSRDVISLLARVFIFLIDRAIKEVPMKNIWRKLLVLFLRYTPLNCYARCLLTKHDVTYVTLHLRYVTFTLRRSTLTYLEYAYKSL